MYPYILLLLLLLLLLLTVHSSESITILETIWKFCLFEISAHVFPRIYFIQYILSLYTQDTLVTFSFVPLYKYMWFIDIYTYNIMYYNE